jgi:hypothetical protein
MKQSIKYACYSLDRQSDTFIEAQLEKIHKNCKEKGYVVVKEYFNVVVLYKLYRFQEIYMIPLFIKRNLENLICQKKGFYENIH